MKLIGAVAKVIVDLPMADGRVLTNHRLSPITLIVEIAQSLSLAYLVARALDAAGAYATEVH